LGFFGGLQTKENLRKSDKTGVRIHGHVEVDLILRDGFLLLEIFFFFGTVLLGDAVLVVLESVEQGFVFRRKNKFLGVFLVHVEFFLEMED